MKSVVLLEKLEEYRLERRMSQTKVADLLGVRFETVNRWLNGHNEPNKIQKYQIMKLLAGKKIKK